MAFVADRLFAAEDIAVRVRELGQAVRARWPGRPVTLLGILKGAAVFLADLGRIVGEPADFAFVRARSYEGETSTGRVELGPLAVEDVAGRRVVVVDTILDTGRTLAAVMEEVRARGAEEVASCVLLDKPSRREVEIEADFVGRTIPDRFVVGYGLDHDGEFRTLPYLGVLDADG